MSIYYFDSIIGSDSFDGLSQEKAFASFKVLENMHLEAGDRLLIHRGQTFSDVLTVNDSGTPENPIIIMPYGTGANPLISVEEQNYVIGIFGEGVELSSIDITNKNGLRGIYLLNKIGGGARHIYVKGCRIFDIMTSGHSHEQGGIIIATNRETPSWYEDVRLENNIIENVHRSGIFFGGCWFNRDELFPWCVNDYIDDENGWYPHKDVYIGGNYIDYAGGDGIVAIACIGLVMEYNKVFHANFRAKEGCASAGLWPMNCKKAIVQYNEVAYTYHPCGGDGMAYDIDNVSEDTIVQYNYSHHNEGGFMLVCNFAFSEKVDRYRLHKGSIIRNNLSVNDCTRIDNPVFTITGPVRDIHILNNTVYNDLDNRYRLFEISNYGFKDFESPSKDVYIYNNIFASKNPNCWNHFRCYENYHFDTNIFYGVPIPQGEGIEMKNAIIENPLFPAEGKEHLGRTTGKSYIPQWESIATREGIITEHSAEKDFYGNDTKGQKYLGAFLFVNGDKTYGDIIGDIIKGK